MELAQESPSKSERKMPAENETSAPSSAKAKISAAFSSRGRPAFLEALEKATGIVAPRKHGFDTVESIHALRDGRAKAFFALGGNFLSAAPDTEYTATALRGARLTAHVSTKLNRAHLVAGTTALILPCLGRTEDDRGRFVTTENSMGVVHSSRGSLEPAQEL